MKNYKSNILGKYYDQKQIQWENSIFCDTIFLYI